MKYVNIFLPERTIQRVLGPVRYLPIVPRYCNKAKKIPYVETSKDKTSRDKTLMGQNSYGTKCLRNKRSKEKRSKEKTSNGTRRLREKTSNGTKRVPVRDKM